MASNIDMSVSRAPTQNVSNELKRAAPPDEGREPFASLSPAPALDARHAPETAPLNKKKRGRGSRGRSKKDVATADSASKINSEQRNTSRAAGLAEVTEKGASTPLRRSTRTRGNIGERLQVKGELAKVEGVIEVADPDEWTGQPRPRMVRGNTRVAQGTQGRL